MAEREKKRVYVVVPKKLMIAWVITFVIMLMLTASSIQWANYVDRRSNQRWCNIVLLFNKAYKENPPPTVLGQKIAVEMLRLEHDFSCENT